MALNDCGCHDDKNAKLSSATQSQAVTQQDVDPPTPCTTTVHQSVTAAAELTVTPSVNVTNIQTFCVGNPSFSSTFPTIVGTSCSFTITQELCAQFDVTFDAVAENTNKGLVACGDFGPGSCPTTPPACEMSNTVDGFTLTLDNVVTNGDGTQTWTYTLTNNTNPFRDLSHLDIVACTTTPVSIVAGSVTGPVTITTTNNPEGSIGCLATTPQRPALEITPTTTPPTNPLTFSFTTTQVYTVANVLWGARAGQDVVCGNICGPCMPVPG
ncbi:hypothetical protein [Rummeliibacillus pycnus]|uniref:hypothetical protein n=1 Tax=Rummeliibacillus pycnus TaxID=101070 RepID=UPI000C9AEB17|nr:hypothetical protein [Rummeliibacillus pycnus]